MTGSVPSIENNKKRKSSKYPSLNNINLLVVQATSDQVTVMLQEKSGQINP
jgi:hypothetical protein